MRVKAVERELAEAQASQAALAEAMADTAQQVVVKDALIKRVRVLHVFNS